MRDQTMSRLGGVVLVVGSLLFIAVFSFLADRFGYPDVLDRPAAEVLPALLAGGDTMRAVWVLYGALPLCFLVAGVASYPVMRERGEALAHLGRLAATVSAGAMMLGLLRWPSIQWRLAQRWAAASEPERASLASTFDVANVFLGNYLGEFVGEVSLYGWYLVLGLALYAQRRWTALFILGSAAIGLVAALRNVTSVVAPVAEVNNLLLPVSLITIGVTLFRLPASRT